VGCGAHSTEREVKSTTSHEVSPSQAEREVIAVDQSEPQPEPVRARPRLSQTITLGQGNSEATYVGPAPAPAPGAAAGGNNVIINNNVIVNQPPAVYGGYGGFGYGRYGSVGVRDGYSRPTTGGSQWGSTGWEGARRTAAPGQTPGVGGNWSPAPSYGPAPMR